MSQSIDEFNSRNQVISSVVSVVSKMSNEHLSHVLRYLQAIDDCSAAVTQYESRLSKREEEVLTLIANGYSRKQIGECLGISANTAARHISTIYSKLGVSTIAEATRYAINQGIA